MPASTLNSAVNRKSPDFEKNTRRIIDLLTQIKNEEQKIRDGGCEAYIAKPISVASFMSTVERFLS